MDQSFLNEHFVNIQVIYLILTNYTSCFASNVVLCFSSYINSETFDFRIHRTKIVLI